MPGLRVAHVTIRVIGLPVWLLRVAPVIRLLIRAMAGMTRILLAHRLIAAERRSWLRRRIPRVIRHIANSLSSSLPLSQPPLRLHSSSYLTSTNPSHPFLKDFLSIPTMLTLSTHAYPIHPLKLTKLNSLSNSP